MTTKKPDFCLLFDSDGTLVDSEALCNQAIAALFANYGVQLSVPQLMLDYRGGQLADVFNKLARQYQVQLTPDTESSYRLMVQQLFDAELKAVAGIKAALQFCQQQGWLMAVVSNGPRAKIHQALKLCGLSDFFQKRIFSAYDINKFKPQPDLYLHAAARLGMPAQSCVVIEDSLPGVQAGLAAGMTTLFYNLHHETSPSALVTEFQDMQLLPTLLSELYLNGNAAAN
jgi:HAD superfamily hydrolase (TIGR01509 family)